MKSVTGFDSFGPWRPPAVVLTSLAAGVFFLLIPFNGNKPSWTLTSQGRDGMVRIEGVIATARKTREAIGIAAESIRQNPENLRAHSLRAFDLLRANYLDDALAEYGAIYDLSFLPGVPDAELGRRVAQINILKILTMMQRYPQAEAAARSAWLADPGNPGIAQYVALFDLMHGHTREAVAVLRDGYAGLDGFPAAEQFRGPLLGYLGNAYEQRGDCDAANALYRMAANDPDIHTSPCKETP